jgi:hypothetical protein
MDQDGRACRYGISSTSFGSELPGTDRAYSVEGGFNFNPHGGGIPVAISNVMTLRGPQAGSFCTNVVFFRLCVCTLSCVCFRSCED